MSEVARAAGATLSRWLSHDNIQEVETGTVNYDAEVDLTNPAASLDARYGKGASQAKGWPANAMQRHFSVEELSNAVVLEKLGLPRDYAATYTDLEDLKFLWIGPQKSLYEYVQGLVPKQEPVPGGGGGQVNDKAAVALKAINERAQAALRAFPQGGGAPAHALRDLATFIAAQAKAVGA